ncbi:heme biosynthesis protein HemY [Qingshengfaniella alkalisoli]|uniref:Heme biosynthesis protein HemY n=1 Tax=Qingshengfaniella alkalisoli TaxID=2599296 RepID=A0A5B8IUV8_9RHOB|nr:heme biosynthesis HemY N-terminal domain-containing protein [Qingshengfaniella alkalisoli]QDY68248.1 heme biosynthesis protein HemY [Qingshengfaniella alkalisoli]
MLWSLIRILIFVVAIAAVIFGVEYLSMHGEGVRIAVANTEFTLGPVQLLIACVVLVCLVWLAIRLAGLALATLHFLAGDETAISRYFARNKERKGFEALSEGLTALAAGDGDEAVAHARKAERLLHRPDLTNLITAQAAEMSGDRARATETYKQLLHDDKTRFVGIRGLMNQKLAEGDTETALKLAEKAFVLKPRHGQVSDTLLSLQAKHANWNGARKTLGAKLKYGAIPRDLHKRRDAVLAVSEAQHRLAAGDAEGARDEAIEAYRLSPTLVPAATAAARAYIDLGKPRNAAKTLKAAWAQEPHPDLAAAFAEIKPNESPQERTTRFRELIRQKPDHPESRMLEAELHLAAEDFPAARKALGQLVETHPNARTLTLMAAIERGEGADDSTVKAWLAKALTAPRGAQWVCTNCDNVQHHWTAICNRCDAFDTLAWLEVQGDERLSGGPAGMLPLIVGAIEDNRAQMPAEDIEDDSQPETVDAERPEKVEEEPTEADADVKRPLDAMPEPAWDDSERDNTARR